MIQVDDAVAFPESGCHCYVDCATDYLFSVNSYTSDNVADECSCDGANYYFGTYENCALDCT